MKQQIQERCTTLSSMWPERFAPIESTNLSQSQKVLNKCVPSILLCLCPWRDVVGQSLVHFDCPSPQNEPDRRFHHFTTQLLPVLLKSAVQSTNTVVFVPSSFDFTRVHNYFRTQAGVSFAVLSEWVPLSNTRYGLPQHECTDTHRTKIFLVLDKHSSKGLNHSSWSANASISTNGSFLLLLNLVNHWSAEP